MRKTHFYEKKGYFYILKCADNSYYTGSTVDLKRRLWQHQNGEGANYTRKRLPVDLIYYEIHDRIESAFRREKQVQGWNRAKKEALIEGRPDDLPDLSKSKESVLADSISEIISQHRKPKS